MKTAQTQQLQAADEDEEMGLNLFDSRALTAEYVGTPASTMHTPPGILVPQKQLPRTAEEDATMDLNIFHGGASTAEQAGTPAPGLHIFDRPMQILGRSNKDLEHTRAPEPALTPHSTRPPKPTKRQWAKPGHAGHHRRNHKRAGWD